MRIDVGRRHVMMRQENLILRGGFSRKRAPISVETMSLHPTLAPESLLRLARAADRTALGKLLEAYRSYLQLLVRLQIGRRLQSKLDADDLVQETFLEAHRTFANFRGKTEKEL